ncbi:hypothetical protein [Rossellomorea sp. NS-SX7]|uniref:hypothetical protein n=1 Tax=Rossellomorea sp. NS-SX7 TaxID=3463856 RepID=UPI0040589CA6
MNKREFKKRLHHFMSKDPKFTEEKKSAILTRIKTKTANKKKVEMRPVLSGLTLLSVGIFLIFFGMQQMGIFEKQETDPTLIATPKENTDKSEGKEKTSVKDNFSPPTQEQINSKVEEIQSTFQLNMTQDEATQAFGKDFSEDKAQNPEGSPFVFWRYEYFNDPDSKRNPILPPGDIDIERLKKRTLGISFSIFWNKTEAHFATIAYHEGDTVKLITHKRDGTVTVDEIK